MCNSFLFSRHRIHDLSVPADDFLIALPPVGVQAAAAVLTPVGTNHEAAPAPGSQQIERAVTEQAVEILRVRPRMAGKVLTVPVGEIGVFFICGQISQSFAVGNDIIIITPLETRKGNNI